MRRPFEVGGRIGIITCLLNILDGEKSFENSVFIHKRKFFDAIFLQDVPGIFRRDADLSSDKFVSTRHKLTDGQVVIGRFDKADIAIGEDANELSMFIRDRARR